MVQWAWQLLLALRKLAMAVLANCGLSAGKAKKTKSQASHTHTQTPKHTPPYTHTPAHIHTHTKTPSHTNTSYTISQMYEANESSAKNWPKSLAGSAFCLSLLFPPLPAIPCLAINNYGQQAHFANCQATVRGKGGGEGVC